MKYRLENGDEIEIGWDKNGWDWADGDYDWLSSKTKLPSGGFFIHGGYVRHQKHIPHGSYSIDQFTALIQNLGQGLGNPTVVWTDDTGSGDPGFWVEGTRPPNQEDVEALARTKERTAKDDEVNLRRIKQRHPEWGIPEVPR